MSATLAAVLPEGLSTLALAAMLAVSFAASFITVAFGIGGGTLLLAAMAALMPPAALIPVHGLAQVGSNLTRALLLLRYVHWAALPAFAVGSLIGVGIGGMIVVDLPPGLVQAGVGLFVLWSVFARPPRWLKRWPALTGAISSFLTMFFGATGLFVAGYSKSLTLPRHAHVATHAALMSVQHTLKVIAFGVLGFAFGPWAGIVIALILAGMIGTFAGGLLLIRISDLLFRRALDAVLILLACRLIWSGAIAPLLS